MGVDERKDPDALMPKIDFVNHAIALVDDELARARDQILSPRKIPDTHLLTSCAGFLRASLQGMDCFDGPPGYDYCPTEAGQSADNYSFTVTAFFGVLESKY